MSSQLFQSREDAGWQLGNRLKSVPLVNPVVLAIPRGGIEVGRPLAAALGAELDIVLSRKLRSQDQPELALGAVSESGVVYLNHHADGMSVAADGHLAVEREHQMAEIHRRAAVFRRVRPRAQLAGRSVIVTDDGIATGSTMIAALKTVRAQKPHELIVAVPVAPEDRLEEVRTLCDRVICLAVPDLFWAVGQFYVHFPEVSDERVVEVLREAAGPTERTRTVG